MACVFGGIDMKPQTAELKGGVEVLIATPGRLLDHIEAKNCVLNQVEYVVLDEADRMLDIGFLPDLQRILSYLPKQRQTLLFSATFSPEIKRLAQSYLQDPILVEVARPNATATNVEQRFYSVTDDDKRRVGDAVAAQPRTEPGHRLRQFQARRGAPGALLRARRPEDGQALHGDKSQDERLKSLAAFKAGEVDLLVATDVAARGLDIADLPAVFNFDVPFNAEDYVHRIGRTGRAGASGLAVTLVDARRQPPGRGHREAHQEEDRDRAARARRRAPAPPAAPRRATDEAAEVPDAVRARSSRLDSPRGAPVLCTSDARCRRSRAPASDPFFDKPYEPNPSGGDATVPAWDSPRRLPRRRRPSCNGACRRTSSPKKQGRRAARRGKQPG